MLVAVFTVHWKNGLFAGDNGIEVPLLYATGAIALALIGYGRYSVDALLGIQSLWTPALTVLALGAGALGGMANLAIRRRPSPPASV
jgi:putative oxidoreductase